MFNSECLVGDDGVDKNISRGGSILLNLGNAYYGLEPWNVRYKPTYYDELLCDGVTRPKSVVLLDKEARDRYRMEKFGVNENNERV